MPLKNPQSPLIPKKELEQKPYIYRRFYHTGNIQINYDETIELN